MSAALAFPDETQCVDAIADALRRHAANNNDRPDKRLARDVASTVESIRNWKQRKCAPSFAKFVALYAAMPEVRQEFHRLAAEAMGDAAREEMAMRSIAGERGHEPWRRDHEAE